jgi:hypothetical protein
MSTLIHTSIPAGKSARLFLLNFPAAHTPNLTYSTTPITADQLRNTVAKFGGPIVSALGHQGAADAFSSLLGQPVPMSRLEVEFQEGDVVLCCKLLRRQPEGSVLDAAMMAEIGFQIVRVDVMRLYAVGTTIYTVYTRAELAALGFPQWAIDAAGAEPGPITHEIKGDWEITSMAAGARDVGHRPLDPEEMVVWARIGALWETHFGAKPYTLSMGGVSRADLADVAEALLLRPHKRIVYTTA